MVERLDGFIAGVFVSSGKIYGVRGVCLRGFGGNRFSSSWSVGLGLSGSVSLIEAVIRVVDGSAVVVLPYFLELDSLRNAL
jgi:hypothetical protein